VTRESAPQLTPLWTAKAPGVNSVASLDVAVGGDVLVVLGDRAVTGISRQTGRTLWTRSRVARCSQGTASGSGVIVMQTGKKCDDVEALDLRSGKVRWTSRVQHHPQGGWYDGLQVGVGRKVATVRTACGAMERFDLASGRSLDTIALDIRDCTFTTATDGRRIIVADRLPDHGEPALMAYDADTGARVWARTAKGAYTRLQEVVSTGPLVLDVTVDRHRLLRTYDAQGRPHAILGRQLPWFGASPDVVSLGARDGVLVGGYSQGWSGLPATVRGWDLATGKERWVLAQPGYTPVGLGAKGLVVATTAATGTPTPSSGQRGTDVWVGERGLGADDKTAALGWIGGASARASSTIIGGLLLRVDDRGRLTAYRLPTTTSGNMPATEADPQESKGWTAADVRPDPTADPCAKVSRSTLRSLGFTDQLQLPAPLDCHWRDFTPGSSRNEVALDVEVHIAEPSVGDTADQTADDTLQTLLRRARQNWDSIGGGGPKPVRISGLVGTDGEAWGSGGGYLGGPYAYLLVRIHNVVVEVNARAQGQVPGWTTSPDRAAAAARSALDDVARAVGLDVATPSPGAEGRYTRAQPVCRLLRTDAARLVPGAEADDLSQPGQQRSSGCRWSSAGTALTVQSYAAAPAALPQQSADAAAAQIYRESSQGKSLPGLGDKADVDTFAYHGDVEVTVTARRGNLVVQVDLDQTRSVADVRADAVRLARKLLAQRG